MGGMRTVIWTDVMQFCLFTFGGLFALGFVVANLDGGFAEYWARATELGRTITWDDRWGFESHLQFTLWVAIFAVPFQNLKLDEPDQPAAFVSWINANQFAEWLSEQSGKTFRLPTFS